MNPNYFRPIFVLVTVFDLTRKSDGWVWLRMDFPYQVREYGKIPRGFKWVEKKVAAHHVYNPRYGWGTAIDPD